MIKVAQSYKSFQLFKKQDSVKAEENAVSPLFFQAKFKYSLCVIITTLNYTLTYDLFRFDAAHIYFFLNDLLLTIVIIHFMIFCIKTLERFLPWDDNPNKRLIVQLATITPIVTLFTLMVNELSEAILYTGRLDAVFYSFDMLVAFVLILMVQFIYIALHFIQHRAEQVAPATPSPSQIKVTQGTTIKLVKEKEILAAFVSSNITYILDKNCKQFLCNEPLKELEEKLSTRFFRANRQFIISREYVLGYKSLEFGKVEVQLVCDNRLTPDHIIISRKKAAMFRKWVKS
ncbi:MAG: LytTR family transcriptional regulator [Roseivirga sp.]|nr:LytTR family transcriptional regulator [Roseivirga sp.]